MNLKTKQQAIFNNYGLPNQIEKAIEELAELTEELKTFNAGEGNIKELTGEIADVENMLDQIKDALSLDGAVRAIKHDKCIRQLARIIDKKGGKNGS